MKSIYMKPEHWYIYIIIYRYCKVRGGVRGALKFGTGETGVWIALSGHPNYGAWDLRLGTRGTGTVQ